MSINEGILRAVGTLAVRQIQRRIRDGRVVPPTEKKRGKTLYKRGALTRSIKWRAEGDMVIISAGDASIPYARIHHEGGVIRPKNAKYLAIPLTPKARLVSAKDYEGDTFIQKGMIFEKKKGKITPIYVLKKEVTIPARPYMFLDDNDRAEIKTVVMNWVEKQLKRGNNA